MEFVDKIPSQKGTDEMESNSLEIGLVKFKNGPVEFEIKDVKVKDVEGLRDFLYEIMEGIEGKL